MKHRRVGVPEIVIHLLGERWQGPDGKLSRVVARRHAAWPLQRLAVSGEIVNEHLVIHAKEPFDYRSKPALGCRTGLFVRLQAGEQGLEIETFEVTPLIDYDGLRNPTMQPDAFPNDGHATAVARWVEGQEKREYNPGVGIKKDWTRASLAALASSFRSFFSFAEARGWCAPGITAAIDSPRLYAREGIPEGPGWDDVQRLLASTSGDRPADIRDHAILMLLAVYGLRRGEVAGLRLDDLDWEGELIHIERPKQRRAQRYPLLPVVGEAILRYLREVRPRCGERTLFLTLGAPIRPLSAPSITPVAHAHLSRLGLTLSPRGAHCLRHACASHLLASGFSLKQIGDHLGHRSASSTLSYTKVDLIGLRQVAELDLGELL